MLQGVMVKEIMKNLKDVGKLGRDDEGQSLWF